MSDIILATEAARKQAKTQFLNAAAEHAATVHHVNQEVEERRDEIALLKQEIDDLYKLVDKTGKELLQTTDRLRDLGSDYPPNTLHIAISEGQFVLIRNSSTNSGFTLRSVGDSVRLLDINALRNNGSD